MSVDVNVDTKISLLSVVDAFNIIELNSRTNKRGGENMNDRDGSIELRLNTKNVDEALSKVRELYVRKAYGRIGEIPIPTVKSG